jgi:hypothetical protein
VQGEAVTKGDWKVGPDEAEAGMVVVLCALPWEAQAVA